MSGSCAGPPANTPPVTPEIGLSYLCGDEPTGVWSGHSQNLACWTTAGWRFFTPFDELRVADRSTGMTWRFAGNQWSSGVVDASEVRIEGQKVLGSRLPSIADPAGGSTMDNEARATLSNVLAALRSHGLIAS